MLSTRGDRDGTMGLPHSFVVRNGMPNLIPTSLYTALAKEELAALADSAVARYGTLAEIENAHMGSGTDKYVHHTGMRDAMQSLADSLRS